MADKPKILLQLDPDAHASAFDAVVAIDAGVDRLLQYSSVSSGDVRGLVHGAIFTRGPDALHRTAIFIGGADIAAGAQLRDEVLASFVGPLRVSVMLDSSGANTTAAAAVVAAARHLPLPNITAAILAATGPVGQRAARLLARAGARVRLTSRRMERAERVRDHIQELVPRAGITAHAAKTPAEAAAVVRGCQLIIAAGAAGTRLLDHDAWAADENVQVAIDLNAVPPAGIEGIDVMDRAARRDGTVCYGAIGVGGIKMKLHKEVVRRLFDRNDQVFDAEEVFDVARQLEP